MDMTRCPLFGGCSAPVCPLDPAWRARTHRRDERLCHWLAEYAKAPTRPLLQGVLAGEYYAALATVYPALLARPGPLRKQLRRAARTPSRLTRRPGRTPA